MVSIGKPTTALKTRGKKNTASTGLFQQGDPSHTKKTLRERERETGHIELKGIQFLHHCDKQASPCPVKRGQCN